MTYHDLPICQGTIFQLQLMGFPWFSPYLPMKGGHVATLALAAMLEFGAGSPEDHRTKLSKHRM
jgi:hypothetical protein